MKILNFFFLIITILNNLYFGYSKFFLSLILILFFYFFNTIYNYIFNYIYCYIFNYFFIMLILLIKINIIKKYFSPENIFFESNFYNSIFILLLIIIFFFFIFYIIKTCYFYIKIMILYFYNIFNKIINYNKNFLKKLIPKLLKFKKFLNWLKKRILFFIIYEIRLKHILEKGKFLQKNIIYFHKINYKHYILLKLILIKYIHDLNTFPYKYKNFYIYMEMYLNHVYILLKLILIKYNVYNLFYENKLYFFVKIFFNIFIFKNKYIKKNFIIKLNYKKYFINNNNYNFINYNNDYNQFNAFIFFLPKFYSLKIKINLLLFRTILLYYLLNNNKIKKNKIKKNKIKCELEQNLNKNFFWLKNFYLNFSNINKFKYLNKYLNEYKYNSNINIYCKLKLNKNNFFLKNIYYWNNKYFLKKNIYLNNFKKKLFFLEKKIIQKIF